MSVPRVKKRGLEEEVEEEVEEEGGGGGGLSLSLTNLKASKNATVFSRVCLLLIPPAIAKHAGQLA